MERDRAFCLSTTVRLPSTRTPSAVPDVCTLVALLLLLLLLLMAMMTMMLSTNERDAARRCMLLTPWHTGFGGGLSGFDVKQQVKAAHNFASDDDDVWSITGGHGHAVLSALLSRATGRVIGVCPGAHVLLAEIGSSLSPEVYDERVARALRWGVEQRADIAYVGNFGLTALDTCDYVCSSNAPPYSPVPCSISFSTLDGVTWNSSIAASEARANGVIVIAAVGA